MDCNGKGGISLFDIKREEQIYSKGTFNLSQLNRQYISAICGQGNYILLATWSSGVIMLNTETGIVENHFDEGIPIRTIISLDEGCFGVGTKHWTKSIVYRRHRLQPLHKTESICVK